MIRLLKNKRTENYQELKKKVLSDTFFWHWGQSTDPSVPPTKGHIHMPYYRHSFLTRPEPMGFTFVESELAPLNIEVLKEIVEYNKLFDPCQYFFLRSSANCNHAEGGIQLSEPHVDHDFPHWNMIVYLEGDGSTFVEGEEYAPQEDDIIIFRGEHYMQRPSKGRRVILISTIFDITPHKFNTVDKT